MSAHLIFFSLLFTSFGKASHPDVFLVAFELPVFLLPIRIASGQDLVVGLEPNKVTLEATLFGVELFEGVVVNLLDRHSFGQFRSHFLKFQRKKENLDT